LLLRSGPQIKIGRYVPDQIWVFNRFFHFYR
jgi:hypothetical protein